MRFSVCVLSCVAALIFGACGGRPQPVVNQAPANANGQSIATSSPIANPPGANANTAAVSMGEPIDTSRYDAEIERLNKQAKRKDGSAVRAALSKAYLDRANALTKARQYRAALGDYRRALRHDPGNEEAEQGAAMIITIMRQMGREVPPEGQEPAPLPFAPGRNSNDDATAVEQKPRSPLVRSH